MAEQLNALIAQYEPRVVALDMSRVLDVEYSALQMLIEGEQRGQRTRLRGLAGRPEPRGARARAPLGLADRLGRERLLFNARAAIERFQARGSEAATTD